MEQKIPFVGSGWSFPPRFDKSAKKVEMLTGEADIESSLEILFTTRLGERIMQPTYGCDMQNMVFEAMNLTLKTYLKDMIETAVLYFEPRITLNSTEIDSSMEYEGVLMIKLDYTIRTTNSRYNYVFPFYINEANNIMTAK
ncbi:MAG: GPW/gp25 family protein [Mucilaginibacter sp.]|uniref:GPW/gp25 family protein n=1 Tax=Mucilaginibacter sp. L3T2-6 TaxID=3062491 RepID=UPI0026762561|nr:GPW/gp25 family protein [Mucilaginibacter sp. L3T2-6]MDO3641553.1 GPW/gp25 family protein [Mucilaginibacter sp. L3T2-6]MDV6214047.1 GPW/gp25 family protein [Mucilaginibacter sp. L3T2-6]